MHPAGAATAAVAPPVAGGEHERAAEGLLTGFGTGYVWLDFEAVGRRVRRLARVLRALLPGPSFCGIVASNRSAWCV